MQLESWLLPHLPTSFFLSTAQQSYQALETEGPEASHNAYWSHTNPLVCCLPRAFIRALKGHLGSDPGFGLLYYCSPYIAY